VFGLFSAFAQLNTLTSRVVIVVYSMPIWATLMAWPIFGERLTRASSLGLMLCIIGLTVLVVPVAASGAPLGLLLALGSSLLWAAGTLYLKWARIEGDPIALTAWQLFFSVAVMLVCLALFQGDAPIWPRQASTFYALAYHGVLGVGISYFLWFQIVGRLPAATASLGILTSPVVGIASSALIIGERPTAADIIGFALILSAAACVLLPSARRPAHPPHREPRAR
jgi:drug/metabolite transporter (DMT)-like permease